MFNSGDLGDYFLNQRDGPACWFYARVLVRRIRAEGSVSYSARSEAIRILSIVKYRSFTYPSSSSTLLLSLRLE